MYKHVSYVYIQACVYYGIKLVFARTSVCVYVLYTCVYVCVHVMFVCLFFVYGAEEFRGGERRVKGKGGSSAGGGFYGGAAMAVATERASEREGTPNTTHI